MRPELDDEGAESFKPLGRRLVLARLHAHQLTLQTHHRRLDVDQLHLLDGGRFGVVWSGLWWFGVVYGGLEWFGVVYGGLEWFMVVWSGLEWFMVVWSGLWWFGVVYGGLEWFGVVYGGLEWFGVVWGFVGNVWLKGLKCVKWIGRC